MVLEYASPHDLLLWQRVNKMWHAVIQRSPRLQEKLYFRIKTCKNMDEQYTADWNPFTDLLFTQSYGCTKCGLSVTPDAFGGKANYPTASWKRMLMTSPATTSMSLWMGDCDYSNNMWHISQTIDCGSGITIGQLADTLDEANVHHADYDVAKVVKFVSKVDHPYGECDICAS